MEARRLRILVPVSVLLVSLFALYWRFAPSKTSLKVLGSAQLGDIPVIRVQFHNNGGKPAVLDNAGYRLIFPPEINIKAQDLEIAKASTYIVEGHRSIDILLTAPGLEPIALSDGTFRSNDDTVASLRNHDALLQFRVEESSGQQREPSEPFPADRISEFVRLQYPTVFPGARQ